MEDYHLTQSDFERWFSTQESCIEYLIKVRWPQGPRCPKCQGTRLWRYGMTLKCSGCRASFRLLAGTMFQDSHLSLVDWFRIMWFISNQKFGLTAMELHKSLGISYSTGWNILRKLRKAMVPAGGELLTGTVEVDEAFIGGLIDGAKGDSKTSNQVLVVMAAELDGKSIERVRVQQIPSATEENLFDFIRSSLKIGTTVITDGWMGYQGLGNNGYLHKVKIMNQEKKALPNIHKMVTLMKRWLLGSLKKFPNKEYLDYYLDEYTFRFNHRRAIMGGQMFLRLVEKALITPPLMREDIRARNIEEQKLFFELPMSNQDIPLF